MRSGMKHILWIENTEVSEKELANALGKDVTLLKSKADINDFSWKQTFDVVVIDDLLEDVDQIFEEMEKYTGKTPVLVLTDQHNLFKTSAKPVFYVGAPFDIPEIQKALKLLEAKKQA